MEKSYRIVSKVEAPLKTHSDFMAPKAIYTLMEVDGQVVRATLPRYYAWEVGSVVKIEEGLVKANLVEQPD